MTRASVTRLVVRAVCVLGVAALLLSAGLATRTSSAAPAPGAVWVTQVKGTIDPPTAGYLQKVMKEAASASAGALIVELDTPGGLDTSMREIIQAEIASPVAVVMYVYPQGARAASAGVYILMGADVAAMAPQTNLGSAHPVSLTGSMDEVMKAKVTNDAAAYIRGLATTHGRNAVWAEQAVRESVNLTAEEAKAQGVIEFVAPDLQNLLQQLDGYTTVPKGITLHTLGVPVNTVQMSLGERLLHIIVDPNIAFALLIVGILGIVFELASPGHLVGAIAGGIALLLSLYAFEILPVNWVGIALIVLAMVLFLAEVKVQSHGALAVGAIIALVLGGILLFNSDQALLRVNWWVVALAALAATAFFFVVIRAVARARRLPPATGVARMVGLVGVVRSPVDPEGQIMVAGELWKAVTSEGSISVGEEVEVLGVENLSLRVRPVQERESPEPGNGDAGPTKEG